jgi:hypothetical protein
MEDAQVRKLQRASRDLSNRTASPKDLEAWADYEKKTSPRPLRKSVGLPVGLLGLVDEADRAKLVADGAKTSPDTSPVAPALNSRRRFQAVQVADVAAWNVTGNPASVPVGLVGVLPDEHLDKIFDEHAQDLEGLRRRNVELASLLHEQQVELEAEIHEKRVEEKLAKEEEHYRRLERTNSLLLNQKIAIACRQFATVSEQKLKASQEQVRTLQTQLLQQAKQLEDAHREIDALKKAQCHECASGSLKVPTMSEESQNYL